MLPWIISVLLLPTSTRALGHPKYECGEHGRFEYCIDGIPGCIVGCHCHPGYYFDTETKICEPNAKLVQDYRRLYAGEPTLVPFKAYSPLDTEINSTPTTTLHPTDLQVDNIAKNADDLGDWLYNQFFNTIESQVINKTVTEKPPTRRSGRKPLNFSEPISKDVEKKTGRRKGKSRKKLHNQKDKRKKEDLRRKLLRISEDDSLFDSSESEDLSSDESDSSDPSDSDDTSDDNESKGGRKKGTRDNDRKHGHRKILMINKKPKAPLPSFIFLPQYDTPFYPPLGLPPPVMYPMIPVPPMPPLPCPGQDISSTSGEHSTEKTTKHDNIDKLRKKPDDKTTDIPPDDTTTAPPDETTTIAPEDTTTAAPDDATTAAPDDATTAPPDTTASLRSKKKRKPLRLRVKPIADPNIKKKSKKQRKPIIPNIPDQFSDTYSPQDFLMKDVDKDNFITKTKPLDDVPGLGGEDVDFKYLAQLIHKMGPNNAKRDDDMKMDMITPLRRNFNQIQTAGNNSPLKTEEDLRTRRNFDRPDRNLERLEDTYYTKLGQQIASLIRNIGSTNERRSEQVPISVPNLSLRGPSLSNQDLNQGSSLLSQDLGLGPSLNPYLNRLQQTAPSSPQPILYENYAPRSYWERSVRSLFNNIHRYPEVLDSKIDNLYKLESRLIMVASTERPLSLTELENVLTIMTKAKIQLQKHTNDVLANDTGNENLNVNLLPQHIEVKPSAQNDNTFHRSTKMVTPITKEIYIKPEEMPLNDDEVTNLNFFAKKKEVTNFYSTRNLKEFPNINASPTGIQMANVMRNKKPLGKINVTHNKKHFKNVNKNYKKQEYINFNVGPKTKTQTNFGLLNFPLNTNKVDINLNTTKKEILDFNNMTPNKKELTIFRFTPNLKDTVKAPLYENKNIIIKAIKDQQHVETPSLMNNVRRNLQGVLINNFRNIPNFTNTPKVETRKYNNNTHINVKDILKLQRYTTNKLKEITNVHNHTLWLTPNVAQFIAIPDRLLLQQTDVQSSNLHPPDLQQTHRITSVFPCNRRVFVEKRFQIPVKTQVFRSSPQSFFKRDDDKDDPYFNHQLHIFE